MRLQQRERKLERETRGISKKANKNITIGRSLDSSCISPKTITIDDHKNA